MSNELSLNRKRCHGILWIGKWWLTKVNTRTDSLASANQFLTHLYALESLTLVLFNPHDALLQQFNISTENKTKVEFTTEHKDKSRMGYKKQVHMKH